MFATATIWSLKFHYNLMAVWKSVYDSHCCRCSSFYWVIHTSLFLTWIVSDITLFMFM